jgi:hypothetical protein
LVEHELGIQRPSTGILTGLAVIEITPLIEQIRPETAALDGLQELLGDDGIGVDVGPIQGRH